MAEDLDARYRRILGKHLAMNPETFSTIQRHGVTSESLLRLDFSYHAPGRPQAEALLAVLTDETDYEVRVEPKERVFGKHWIVNGRTQPTTVFSRDPR